MTPTTNTAVTDTPNLSQDAAADMAPTNAAKEHPAIGQPAGTDPMQKTLTGTFRLAYLNSPRVSLP